MFVQNWSFLRKKLRFWSNICNYRLKNSKCRRVKPRSDVSKPKSKFRPILDIQEPLTDFHGDVWFLRHQTLRKKVETWAILCSRTSYREYLKVLSYFFYSCCKTIFCFSIRGQLGKVNLNWVNQFQILANFWKFLQKLALWSWSL